MPVKYWSFAGLMLTYWCNARCASCYLCCSPTRREEMSVAQALGYWAGLAEASPHGCRMHLSGGEPFGNWPRLIDLCLRAQHAGITARAPLVKVETNAFWATDESIVRDRLVQLDRAGMGKLSISADPYHQQFVPIANCRLAARVAAEILGPDRVQVRWRDWLEDGFDTDSLSDAERGGLFVSYAAKGKDRFNGRAAEVLAGAVIANSSGPMQRKSPDKFVDNPCRHALLRSRHVHVDASGLVMPGTCAGIVLGDASKEPVSRIWARLDDDHDAREIVGTLSREGPAGLLRLAEENGYEWRKDCPTGYVGKCHLCWSVRRFLSVSGKHHAELGPGWLYEPERAGQSQGE